MAILVRVNAWVNSIIVDTGAAAAGVNEIYLRPGGVDEYRRPGGTDSYLRP